MAGLKPRVDARRSRGQQSTVPSGGFGFPEIIVVMFRHMLWPIVKQLENIQHIDPTGRGAFNPVATGFFCARTGYGDAASRVCQGGDVFLHPME
jgi:hypothetical protein